MGFRSTNRAISRLFLAVIAIGVLWQRPSVALGEAEDSKTTVVKTVTLPGEVEMRFRWCPAGVLINGDTCVAMTNGFWIGETEVTQRQWDSMMDENLSYFKGNANLPVEGVSWDDCQAFIRKVKKLTGLDVSLPTEAQWEHACRVGGTCDYTGVLDAMAWLRNNSGKETHPVATKKPNAWGIFDMYGNVSEWCQDSSHSLKKIRGGSWIWEGPSTRWQDYRSNDIGFRLVCSVSLHDKETSEVERAATEVRKVVDEHIVRVTRERIEREKKREEEDRKERELAIQPHKAGEERVVTLPGGAEMRFRWCPAGTFMMGSPKSEKGRDLCAIQHQVTLTKGFWIGETEVTQRQWLSVMGNNPSSYKGDDNLPVETVTWHDSQAFIDRIKKQTVLDVSLPTEAQWEYACRAGGTGNHPEALDAMAWYRENSNGKAHPVGLKVPNKWGIFDMYGNVEEWCQDWFGDYLSVTAVDPIVHAAWDSPSGPCRVARGGYWGSRSDWCRPDRRGRDVPNWGNPKIGFRLVCHPKKIFSEFSLFSPRTNGEALPEFGQGGLR